jgi:hypothetical protein
MHTNKSGRCSCWQHDTLVLLVALRLVIAPFFCSARFACTWSGWWMCLLLLLQAPLP